MEKRKLTDDEKANIAKSVKDTTEVLIPGSHSEVRVEDHVDENGKVKVRELIIREIIMPPGWKPGDPLP